VTTRGRCHQIFRWLLRTFPPPTTTRLRIVAVLPKDYEDCLGACIWNDADEPMIWLKDTSRSETISTLIHEYAHVLTGLDHEDEFYLMLGKVERAYWDSF